jgi:hypothetical protein
MMWSLRIAPTAAAWIAMTLVASAAPLTTDVEIPTGDVWITPQAPGATPPQIAQRAPAQRALPTGDFWPADDDTTVAAAPAPPRDQSASRQEVAGRKP